MPSMGWQELITLSKIEGAFNKRDLWHVGRWNAFIPFRWEGIICGFVGQMPSGFVKQRALNILLRGKKGQPADWALSSGSGSAESLSPQKLFRTVAVHWPEGCLEKTMTKSHPVRMSLLQLSRGCARLRLAGAAGIGWKCRSWARVLHSASSYSGGQLDPAPPSCQPPSSPLGCTGGIGHSPEWFMLQS